MDGLSVQSISVTEPRATMCIAFLLNNVFPPSSPLALLLAFNRDEMMDRDAEKCHHWEDTPGVVGGRDCAGRGTWLCASSLTGRISFLTNVRERADLSDAPHPPSRGELPVNFVSSTTPASEYLTAVQDRAQHYAGFNLIAVEAAGGQAWYLTNRGEGGLECPGEAPLPEEVAPGVHGLSNSVLDDLWPKVALGRRRFEDLLGAGAFDAGDVPWEAVFGLMSDATVLETDPAKLPHTGYGAAVEAALSGIFVNVSARQERNGGQSHLHLLTGMGMVWPPHKP